MEWSDEEKADLEVHAFATSRQHQWSSGAMIKAIATRAVELVSARGGTMTADHLEHTLKNIRSPMTTGEGLRAHLAAQGARIAVLEAELAMARTGFDPGSPAEATIKTLEAQLATEQRLHEGTRVMHREAMRVHESDKGAIRHRALEAGNPERLIAEKGIPTAMRWVVDEEEPSSDSDGRPYPQRMPHTFVRWPDGSDACYATTHHGNRCGWSEYDHRYPCSPTCTHDDAATPGHLERMKERSEAFKATHPTGSCTCAGEGTCQWCHRVSKPTEWGRGYDYGSEAMRAACLLAVKERLTSNGWNEVADRSLFRAVEAAIEGATP